MSDAFRSTSSGRQRARSSSSRHDCETGMMPCFETVTKYRNTTREAQPCSYNPSLRLNASIRSNQGIQTLLLHLQVSCHKCHATYHETCQNGPEPRLMSLRTPVRSMQGTDKSLYRNTSCLRSTVCPSPHGQICRVMYMHLQRFCMFDIVCACLDPALPQRTAPPAPATCVDVHARLDLNEMFQKG
jgi:hypothetical protein